MVRFAVLQSQGFLPSGLTKGGAAGCSPMTPVSAPMHDTVSADVVMRMPFGIFFVGFPIVIPSNDKETKVSFGTRTPLIAITNDENDLDSKTERTVVTVALVPLPSMKMLLAGIFFGPSANSIGGKLTVIVDPEGKSL